MPISRLDSLLSAIELRPNLLGATKMTFKIRRMTELDIDNVYAIEKDVHIVPWSRGVLYDCVRIGYDCRVFEIEVDSKTILGGYIISRHSNQTCHILNFCVARSLQSRGYGRKFLCDVLASLEKQEDIKEALLEVRPSNKVALHLYESMGFKQIEIKKNYYEDDKGSEDAILLRKIFY